MRIEKIPSKARFLIMWFLCLSPFLIYGTYLEMTYEIAEIANLSVGYMKNDSMIFPEVIPRGENELFACGRITTRGSNYLTMTLHSVDEKTYYGKEFSNDRVPAGDFCLRLILNGPLEAGSYKLIVIDSHKRVGEYIFQVK